MWSNNRNAKMQSRATRLPALPQHVQDVVSEGVSVLLQHPPHVIHHLCQATTVRQREAFTGANKKPNSTWTRDLLWGFTLNQSAAPLKPQKHNKNNKQKQILWSHLSCIVFDSKVVHSNTWLHIERVFLQEKTCFMVSEVIPAENWGKYLFLMLKITNQVPPLLFESPLNTLLSGFNISKSHLLALNPL